MPNVSENHRQPSTRDSGVVPELTRPEVSSRSPIVTSRQSSPSP